MATKKKPIHAGKPVPKSKRKTRDMMVFLVEFTGLPVRVTRMFAIEATASFADLHRAIQSALDWEDRHLYDFRLPNEDIICQNSTEFGDITDEPEHTPLVTYFSGIASFEWCLYVYDYGDDWTLDVKIVERTTRVTPYARELVLANLAAPPEDCGGVPGYLNILDFLETGIDHAGDDPEGLAEWLGDWTLEAPPLGALKKRFDKKSL